MKWKIASIIISVFSLLSLASTVFATPAMSKNLQNTFTEKGSKDKGSLQFVPGEILVKFRRDLCIDSGDSGIITGFGSVDLLNERFGVTSISRAFSTGTTIFSNLYKIKVPKEVDVVRMAHLYSDLAIVEYAEPNFIYQTFVTPNDPQYSEQWAHVNMESELAWDIETGEPSTVIAIVDTGVDWNHPDLAANIWNNTDEIPGNELDDDNNGYIDDVRGWDFVEVPPELPWFFQPAPGEDGTERDNDPMDFDGHGTHCSGIAAAVTDNDIGIAGTCWNVQIMPSRAGYQTANGMGILIDQDAAAAIEYAAQNGADVISMSWGGYSPSETIEIAIDYAYDQGVVLVGAAGNSNSRAKHYPSAHDEVIAVAATTMSDGKAYFSNYGSWVDICAPGVNISSTMFDDTYAFLGGTSMATPFAAGLAGLILSKDPSFTNEEVRNILRSTTDSVTSTVHIGTGRINAYKAIQRDTILIADFNSSLDDTIVHGIVELTGTADGPNFQSYKAEYGLGVYPSSWTRIGSMHYSPVVDGTLATWDSSLTTDGEYTIKLTAVAVGGKETVDMVVLTVDNSDPAYWPYLTVLSQDQNGNSLTEADVYIDGDLVGYSGSAFKVSTGYHEVFVNDFWESGSTSYRYGFAYWNDYTRGNKTIRVVQNTTLTAYCVKWHCPGDVDGNGIVDDTDVNIVSVLYGIERGDPNWNSRADLVRDLEINIYDVVMVTGNYGVEYWADLRVNALNPEGYPLRILDVWIDGQLVGKTGSTFTIHPGPREVRVQASYYVKNWLGIFDHWEDGSTRNPRIVSLDEDRTVTAHYIKIWFPYPPE